MSVVLPGLAQAPPTIVTSNGYINGTPLTAHTSNPFNSTGATLLVALVSTNTPWNGLSVNINGVSDNAGNTWTALTGPTLYGGTGSYQLLSGIYYVNAPYTRANHTVTATLSNPAPLVMQIFAVGGSDVSGPPVFSAITNPGATGTTDVLTADISVPANNLLLAWVKNETSATAIADDAWLLDTSSTSFLWAEYMTAGTAGSYHGHFTYNSAIGWQTAVVGVNPSSTPVAQNLSVSTIENTSVAVTLSATSPNNSTLTYTVLTQPSHGTLSGTAPNLTYTPTIGYYGSDSFSYKASNSSGDSNVATVSITVSPASPVANNANVNTPENTPVAITLTGSDPNGSPLTYTVLTQPTQGTLTGTAPNLTYTPNSGYSGSDSFTFQASDALGLTSNVATISISVLPLTGVGILTRTGYLNGTPLTAHTSAPFNSTGATLLVAFVSTNTPWNGLSVNINGLSDNAGNTWTALTGPTLYGGTGSYPLLSGIYYVNAPATSSAHTVTATLSNGAPLVMQIFAVGGSDTSGPPVFSAITNPGPTGTTDVVTASISVPADSLLLAWVKNETGATATAQDAWTLDSSSTSYLWAEYMTAGTAGSYHGHFAYNTAIGWQAAIVGVKPMLPVAQNLSVSTTENTAVAVTLSATSPNNSPLTYTVLTQPVNGSLSGTAPNLTYTPNTGYYGSDSFTYKATNSSGDSNVATVTITVTLVAQPPIANNANVATAENTPVPITLTASDPNGSPLTYTVVTQPSDGTLTGTAPNLTYTPTSGYLGSDSFTFHATDALGLTSNVATVSISVVPATTVPTIVARTGYLNSTPQSTHTTNPFNSTGATLLVAFVSTHPTWNSLPVSINGVSDNAGNTWTALTGPTSYGGTGSFPLLSGIYYVNTPATSSVHTVTATLSNPAPLTMQIFAVTDGNTSGPPVFSAITNPGTTPTTDVVTADISVAASSLLLAWVKNETSATATALDTWTLDSSSTSFLWAEYMTADSTGSYHGHFTYDTATGWQTAVVGVPPLPSAPPTISESFGASAIPLNGTTSLSFTISNPNTSASFTGLTFTDALPSGIVVASTPSLSNTCGGTATATAGSSSVSLSGATLAPSGSCVVSVNVTGTTAGVFTNSVTVTSNQGGSGNTNATLTVVGPPTIQKSFGASSIPLGGTTSLTFTMTNPNTSTTLTGIGFSDTLPTGLVISTPNGLTTTCAGTVTAAQGTNVVSLAGGSLAAGASCTIAANVTATAVGAQNNITANITSNEGGTGGTASASVSVYAALVSIAVSPSNPSVSLSGTQQFTATGTYNDGSRQDLTSTATWSSSSTSVATINATGLATAVGPGSTTIQAAVGSVSGPTTLTVTPATVTFLKTDTTTQGNWASSYGADGYNVVGNTTAYPSYATVTPSGENTYVWASSTTDIRALQKSGSADRIAATWYSGSFAVDVNLTDGKTHQIALYCLDWDNGARAETISISDATTGTVLDSRSISSFVNGEYLVWNISGHVTITVTLIDGSNAVVSGIFFGGSAVTSSAAFVKSDTTTQGNWKSRYGADGYNVIGDTTAYPSYATVTASGQNTFVWESSTTDIRALQKSASTSDRIAGTWYSGSSFTVDVNLTDGKTHQLALYCLDWDNGARAQTISISDATTGTVLDGRSISSFVNGEYLVWNISGHVTVTVTLTGGSNPVVSGIFFGGGYTVTSSAAFVKTDTTTQGNWKLSYGADGYNVIGDTTAYPSYATVTPSGQNTFVWASSTTDIRALEKSASTSDRIAAAWYSGSSFTVDVNLTDGKTHQLALYCLDWDNGARAETISISDATTGTVLDSRSINSFVNGEYLIWNISGHVTVIVTWAGGSSAVVSGIFFGGSMVTASATFVTADTITEGNWKGTYGANGYNVIGDTTSYPSYATVTPSGQNSYVWASSTSDIRALEKASSNTDRIAATWYGLRFTIDVNLTDGNPHQIALYCLDWDNGSRAETISISDAATGTLLDSRSISSFINGEYLVWNVSGHITLTVTSTGGSNAVVSGIFF